jgi:hypothetical protein
VYVQAASSDSSSQLVTGSAASSVGANFIPAELKSSTKFEVASAAADSTQEAAAQAAQQQARRQHRQQQEGAQQQRALGRKGGPQLRQASPAPVDPADPTEVFIGDLDDYVLPFCQPTEGVVCSGALVVCCSHCSSIITGGQEAGEERLGLVRVCVISDDTHAAQEQTQCLLLEMLQLSVLTTWLIQCASAFTVNAAGFASMAADHHGATSW